MARRYDHSREKLQEMAIEAGWNMVQSEGLGNFSARKVAAEIGYTVGTIYNVFETHDNLILHINARTLDRWYEDLKARMARRKTAPSIEDLALYYIEYSAAHYNEWMALFEHTPPRDMAIPEWYAPKLRRFFEVLETMAMPYVRDNKRKARRAARVLWAGIHGICLLSLTRKLDLTDSESAQILAKSFVQNYLHGLEQEG